MKKLATAIAAIALFATPAFAADMAVKASPPPPRAPVYNWTGFYVGGNAGYRLGTIGRELELFVRSWARGRKLPDKQRHKFGEHIGSGYELIVTARVHRRRSGRLQFAERFYGLRSGNRFQRI